MSNANTIKRQVGGSTVGTLAPITNPSTTQTAFTFNVGPLGSVTLPGSGPIPTNTGYLVGGVIPLAVGVGLVPRFRYDGWYGPGKIVYTQALGRFCTSRRLALCGAYGQFNHADVEPLGSSGGNHHAWRTDGNVVLRIQRSHSNVGGGSYDHERRVHARRVHSVGRSGQLERLLPSPNRHQCDCQHGNQWHCD